MQKARSAHPQTAVSGYDFAGSGGLSSFDGVKHTDQEKDISQADALQNSVGLHACFDMITQAAVVRMSCFNLEAHHNNAPCFFDCTCFYASWVQRKCPYVRLAMIRIQECSESA